MVYFQTENKELKKEEFNYGKNSADNRGKLGHRT